MFAEMGLSVLAIACSIAALSCSLVVAIRSTPQKVRRDALDAKQCVEEMHGKLQLLESQNLNFMQEVLNERQVASADLQEAERKRRQAAAKLSKVNKATGEEAEQPVTMADAMAQFPPGDPRRLRILRTAKAGSE